MRAIVFGVLIACAAVCAGAASSETHPNMTREIHGLHGPVKTCMTEAKYETEGVGFSSETVEFDREGRLVRTSGRYPSQPEWSTTYVFDEQGRVLRETSTQGTTTTWEKVNSYDEVGRLSKVTTSGGLRGDSTTVYEYGPEGRLVMEEDTSKRGVSRTEYRHENGRKTMVKTVPAQAESQGAVGIGADILMESAITGDYGLPQGGTVTAVFDEQDRPVEAKLANPQGVVHTRIVRTYDAQGRIAQTRSIMEDPLAMFAAELPKELASADPAQLEMMKAAMMRMIGGNKGATSITNKYDKLGRVIERKTTVLGSRDHVQAMAYNEHGDLVSEKTDMDTNPDAVTGVSTDEMGNIVETRGEGPPPMHSESKFDYQYDSFRNWTEKTVYLRASPDDEFKRTTVMRRTITYY